MVDNGIGWYLRQAGRVPMLTPSEEISLGNQVKAYMEIRDLKNPTPEQNFVCSYPVPGVYGHYSALVFLYLSFLLSLRLCCHCLCLSLVIVWKHFQFFPLCSSTAFISIQFCREKIVQIRTLDIGAAMERV